MSSPTPPLARHLRRRGGQPGGAEVLQRDEQLAVQQLQAALEQLLLGERVADLHRRALGLVALAELGARRAPRRRRSRRARSARRAARDVAGPGGGAADQPLVRREPEAHRVDQAVLLVAGLEVDLAADGRDADRVAVVADPGDGVLEQVARALGGLPARRSAASRAPRSAGRRRRTRRAGSPRRRWRRPGTARPRSGGCGTRP